MDHFSSSTTSLSLLGVLKNNPDDPRSWQEFFDRYSPRVFRWCRDWGLQEADAHDVTQNVFLKLAVHMKRFEYRQDGRFRSWLRRVSYNAWRDYAQSIRRQSVGSKTNKKVCNAAEAADDLVGMIDREYTQHLFEQAAEAIQQRVELHVWQAFEMMGLQQLPAREVCDRLGISQGNAYVAKSRVQLLLTEEIARLESMLDE